MRYSNAVKSVLFTCTSFAVTATLLTSVPGLAKTDKYQRPSSSSSDDSSDSSTAAGTTSKKPSTASGQNAVTPAGAGATTGGDKKVDLSDLENRYWTAKDTEFNVVQNRLYTKAHRFSVEPMFGAVLNDNYTSAYNYGASINYYFSERQGVELSGWITNATDADFVNSFGSTYGIIPDHNRQQGYVGANYNWIPIYAKLSLLEKKILYFDLSISPGVGVTFLKSASFSDTSFPDAQSVSQTAPTFALDLTEHFYIDEHWAFRIDLRNHLYNEDIYKSDAGTKVRSKITYDGAIMLGLTYFIGTGQKPAISGQ